MSIAEAEMRARLAAQQANATAAAELVAKVEMLHRIGATVVIDFIGHDPSMLGRIVRVSAGEGTLLDMGDARVFPKRERRVGIGSIRRIEAT